jgi:hypothetical protein
MDIRICIHFNHYKWLNSYLPITVAALSKTWTVFAHLNAVSWIQIPLKSRCSSVFRQRPCVGLIPRPRSPLDCLKLRNWKRGQGPTNGCRAIDSRFTRFMKITHKRRNVRKVFRGLLLELASWSWALLDKLPVLQLLKNFPAFYGSRTSITVFTKALHCSLFWVRSIQSTPPHPLSLKINLTLSTHLSLGLPSGLFPSGFRTNYPTCIYLLPIRATCPANFILLDLVILVILGEEYNLCSLV